MIFIIMFGGPEVKRLIYLFTLFSDIIFWITTGKTSLSQKHEAYVSAWFDILFRYFGKFNQILQISFG